jgi:hypothetical protein
MNLKNKDGKNDAVKLLETTLYLQNFFPPPPNSILCRGVGKYHRYLIPRLSLKVVYL